MRWRQHFIPPVFFKVAKHLFPRVSELIRTCGHSAHPSQFTQFRSLASGFSSNDFLIHFSIIMHVRFQVSCQYNLMVNTRRNCMLFFYRTKNMTIICVPREWWLEKMVPTPSKSVKKIFLMKERKIFQLSTDCLLKPTIIWVVCLDVYTLLCSTITGRIGHKIQSGTHVFTWGASGKSFPDDISHNFQAMAVFVT